ncbi:hypothetical protein DY000_02052156 [Brassica cretica]|uniref:Uncharacterized protein n=1 Tax=Brassica cretica TaxID=69181 RepID=A0ABQ7AMQ1_BRACR|nr:hypothetical protein DY000_02052156 [Brassica cretica]
MTFQGSLSSSSSRLSLDLDQSEKSNPRSFTAERDSIIEIAIAAPSHLREPKDQTAS